MGRTGSVRVALAVACALCGLWWTSGIARAATATVRTVACPTEFGAGGPHPRIPDRVAVRGNPRSIRGLVAYAEPYAHIIGPAGMRCSALVGADGSQGITVWPKGQREARAHSDGSGLALTVIPACVGCMYSLVCPLDRPLANLIYPGNPFPCTAAPRREQIVRQGDLLLFTDPPGVAGDGSPSGGPLDAYGVVGWTRRNGAFAASCTLPVRLRSICTGVLNDAIAALY